MPYIPQNKTNAKALPTPIQSRPRKKVSIKEPKLSITGWNVDPRRIQRDLQVK